MVKKGEHRYEQQTLHVVRVIGLVAPLFLFGYGLFIVSGSVTSLNYHGPTMFWVIMATWLALAAHQFVRPPQTKLHMLINTSAYHILAGLYILFISSFTLPFLSAWALLYLVSYIYFAYPGLLLSIIVFFFILIADATIRPSNADGVFFSILSSVSILLVGLAAISLNRIKEYDRETIARSKRGEALERERLLTLVNNLADPIVSTDQKGTIKLYNAAMLGLLDTNTPLDNRHIDSVLALTDAAGKTQRLMPLLEASRSVTIEDGFITAIGDEMVRLEITYSPIRGDSGEHDDGYVVIIRDVTKAKSLEEERDEFISVVSHELRTPIAITEGAIDNAKLIYDKEKDSKKVSQSLALAHEQVLFLSKMVNDLSTLSRAERGASDTPEVIDVNQFAHDLHVEYSDEATAKGLAFNLSVHPPLGNVLVSRLYLHELLQNFITNAIKYTKKGSVTLDISRQGDQLLFSVKDSGIGISKTDQTKIFQKFYRSEDYRTRETGGTGLGLYVAVKLAKKLGCTIEVKSRLNHGSTFSFSLPLHKETTSK